MKKLILCSMIAGILMLFAACGANETSQPVSPSPAASPTQTAKPAASPAQSPVASEKPAAATPAASAASATATP